MTRDPLQELAALWRDEAPAPVLADRLARRVRRHAVGMTLLSSSEIALAAAILWLAWPRRGAPGEAVTFGALVLLAVVIVAFALWNRRGAWRGDVATPAAYLDWAERRARARLRTAFFVQLVTWGQAAGTVTLVAVRRHPADDPAAFLAALALALALAATAFGWAVWYARRARRDLADVVASRALLAREADLPL